MSLEVHGCRWRWAARMLILLSTPTANQLNQIIQNLNTAVLNATSANQYPMGFIQCYVVPVFGPLLPYGLYQRRQCFMCVSALHQGYTCLINHAIVDGHLV